MQSLAVFKLVSDNTRWLSTRQAVVAENVANANTPGFKSADVQPFAQALDGTRIAMAATHARHLAAPEREAAAIQPRDGDMAGATESGNSVVLETEMMKLGEMSNAFALNAGIVKTFHRMLLNSAKG